MSAYYPPRTQADRYRAHDLARYRKWAVDKSKRRAANRRARKARRA